VVSEVSLKSSATSTFGGDQVFRIRRDLQTLAKSSMPVERPHVSITKSVPKSAKTGNPVRRYILSSIALTALGLGVIFNSNRVFNAPMYDEAGMAPAAAAFSKGLNYATFDLNINIRKLRAYQVASLPKTPDVVFFGASQLQEAHKELLPGIDYYNSHIHRDYWQDLFAVTDIWLRRGELPKTIVISMRDKLFTPMALRKDYLWEPGIPYWRDLAAKMNIAMEPVWQSLPYQRFREKLSLSMLFSNVTRWYNAEQLPHESSEKHFKSLDTLLPDGSILWSQDHMKVFTPERSKFESLKFATAQANNPPIIEKQGIENVEKLLDFLKSKGVTVYIMQPPFNPIYWNAVQGTPYFKGLQAYDAMVRDMAKRHGIEMIGGFNPNKVGCDETQYIDAEHANPSCLKHVFDQFMSLHAKQGNS
jgi:hypothetical protein